MKILIISSRFYPNNEIGAFRMEAFAKYFQQAGHSVTVVTDGNVDETKLWHGCKIHYIKDPLVTPSYLERCVREGKRLGLRKIANALLIRLTADTKFMWRLKAYKKTALLCEANSFDVVLSSFMPLAPHMIAYKLRKNGYKFYWIADMRDEMSKLVFRRRYQARHLLLYERKIVNLSDLVVSVSKPLLSDFKYLCKHDNFLEIRNGYDFEEIHDVCFQSQFTMAFFGHFHRKWVSPANWFKAFSELIKEGKLPSDCRIKIIGYSLKLDVPQDIASNVLLIPPVVHSEAIRMSLEADTLVVIHSTGRKGVYTGKLFDYLATNKPILALCDPEDVIAGLLEETKAGFTVDNADIAGIKKMILRCYSIWKNKEVLPRDWEKIRQYTRKNQCKILLDYLANVQKLT
ncbi:glycosyl transferase [Parabacteroides gordonii]|jgi:hypothetical protein|uniref:glycosyl transferase n=1 Tax=Parabacteroides gordonii TaxID=574930 RepID=UPI00241E16CD|nr:glycosyl transferase [Parabacteroides gordonii]